MKKRKKPDELDLLTNEIEQGFMQYGGWNSCRYVLGKLVKRKDEEIELLEKMVEAGVGPEDMERDL